MLVALMVALGLYHTSNMENFQEKVKHISIEPSYRFAPEPSQNLVKLAYLSH